jgi:AhpD family alkylhydroperoxidase
MIEPITADTAPITIRNFFSNGNPGPILSTLAHVPEIMKVTLPFIGKVLGESSIDIRTKEIVILRTSVMQKCRYCVATHSFVANKSGLSKDEILSLRDLEDGTSAFLLQREIHLVRWTDVIAIGPQEASTQIKQEMLENYTEAEIVELTLLIGATVMLNRYATAFELPIDSEHIEYLQEKGL